jgi:hypothetical protein
MKQFPVTPLDPAPKTGLERTHDVLLYAKSGRINVPNILRALHRRHYARKRKASPLDDGVGNTLV